MPHRTAVAPASFIPTFPLIQRSRLLFTVLYTFLLPGNFREMLFFFSFLYELFFWKRTTKPSFFDHLNTLKRKLLLCARSQRPIDIVRSFLHRHAKKTPIWIGAISIQYKRIAAIRMPASWLTALRFAAQLFIFLQTRQVALRHSAACPLHMLPDPQCRWPGDPVYRFGHLFQQRRQMLRRRCIAVR